MCGVLTLSDTVVPTPCCVYGTQVRSSAVSDTEKRVAIGIPRDGTYWGLASVDNLNLQPKEGAPSAAGGRMVGRMHEPLSGAGEGWTMGWHLRCLASVNNLNLQPREGAAAGKVEGWW